MQPDFIFAFDQRNDPAPPSNVMQGEKSVFWRKISYVASVPEVLITVVMAFFTTVVLLGFAPVLGLPDWSGLLSGAAGTIITAILFWVAMGDPELNEWAVTEELKDRLALQSIRNEDVRRHVLQIILDRSRLERHGFYRRGKDKRIANMVSAMDAWLWSLKKLVATIDPVMEHLSKLTEQKSAVLARIEELESRAAMASAPFVKQQFRETIAGRLLQIRSMEELESQVEQGLLRLEHAVSVFAAVDSKLAMLGTSEEGLDGSEMPDLFIREEIAEIDAVVAAMRHVYVGSGQIPSTFSG